MRIRLVVLLMVVALVALPARGIAVEVVSRTSAAELVSAESGLDGSTVTFEGEVVSEVLAGGRGHVWVNVLSDGVAIGVWAPAELADDLEVFGDWGHNGDRVVVTGTFNQACDVHGGDLDVHATSVELLERGSERHHPAAFWKLGVGAGGIVLGLLGHRRMRRREEDDRW
ncbi:MAG: hypothetical protein Q7W51_03465 [Coriobacteriia bacterium]|nr:hypothetical protein [Coriobacteriia bacterium]